MTLASFLLVFFLLFLPLLSIYVHIYKARNTYAHIFEFQNSFLFYIRLLYFFLNSNLNYIFTSVKTM